MRKQGFGLRSKIGEGQDAISAGGYGGFGEESQGPRGQRLTVVLITIDPVDSWVRKQSSSSTGTVRVSYQLANPICLHPAIGSVFLTNAVGREKITPAALGKREPGLRYSSEW